MLKDNTGFFDTDNDEYIIENMRPKRPLINYLWSERVVASYSHLGRGEALACIGEKRRKFIDGERLVYIRDNENGYFFSPNRNFENAAFGVYETHVGIGYQCILSAHKGIACRTVYLIPDGSFSETVRITLENTTGKEKNISLFYYTQPVVNLTEHLAYGEGGYDAGLEGLYFQYDHYLKTHEYNYVFAGADRKIDAFCTASGDFTGEYGQLSAPESLKNGRLSCVGTTFCEDYCAAMQFDITLPAHGQEEVCLLIAAVTGRGEAENLKKTVFAKGFFDAQLEAQRELNLKYKETFQMESPDAYADALVNTWLKRQISLGKTWGRVYGKGFRDVMQDVAGFVSFDGKLAEERILYALKHQYISGNTIRMYEPDLLHPYNDGAAWIPATVLAYIKETGDLSVLSEKVGYLDSAVTEDVLAHAVRGVGFLLSAKGARGLTLWGGGDWNDSLNNAGMKGRGESVWLSIAAYKAAYELLEIADIADADTVDREKLRQDAEELKENILRFGSDGEHFLYGYNDEGQKVGSDSSAEAKIFLNPQTWAVLAGIVKDEKAHQLMDVVEKRLKCPYGYMQNAPSYSKGDDSLGRATYFVPGIYENGSVYNHGVAFKLVADCMLKRGENAYETLCMMYYTNPDNPDSGMEPYAVSNMFLGPECPHRKGDAPLSWITGTASWLYRGITEHILGIRAEYDGLKIDPCLPSSFTRIKIRRKFRGTLYNVEILKDPSREKGLYISGKKHPGNLIPPLRQKHLDIVCVL